MSAEPVPPSSAQRDAKLSAESLDSQAILANILTASPHDFLQPPQSLHLAALRLTKDYLDPLAAGVSAAQEERLKEERRAGKKRKRGAKDLGGRTDGVLRLKKVHVDGFGVQQVWGQVRRVVDAVREEVERSIRLLDEQASRSSERSSEDDGDAVSMPEEEMADGSQEGSEISSDEIAKGERSGKKVRWDLDDEGSPDWVDGNGIADEDNRHGEADHNELSDIEEGSNIGECDDDADDGAQNESFVEDRNGLNDGFFSIDDFNRRSEFLERQDAMGDPDDGAASDEEEIDWAADPLTTNVGLGRDQAGGEEEDGEDEDDGPTFGNADLMGPDDASDQDEEDGNPVEEGEMDVMGDLSNTNNIMYADFFAPPAKKASKKKRGRPNPHNFPSKVTKDEEAAKDAEDAEDDIERTIAAVHRDLFEDDDTDEDSADGLSDRDPSDPMSRRSTHERRQAKIAEEIRRLEAANVAKREWTLSGEARAADRPMNSLLEEDLDFERAGKPVPVITAEVSEDIEALIKRRIIAKEFDEVIRRRPDNLATGGSGPQPPRRGRLDELDDTKAQKSLAELYADEHLRRTDPNYVDQRDERLRKAHAEIEALWRDVSSSLDALASWHYRPKPATANLEIRVDAPTITMEDARPALGPEVGGASRLAPQEIYAAGQEKAKDEVVTKGGLVIARDEMTREEKRRRRRREKERIRKSATNAPANGRIVGKKTEEKNKVISELKRGGVKVIGRKGEVRDIEGKPVKQHVAHITGGSFKL